MENINSLIHIGHIDVPPLPVEKSEPYYLIWIFDGDSIFSVDFTEYKCKGKNLLFLSPFQLLKWSASRAEKIDVIRFHGDFYCIEYHKEEVACNGILFNNIYQQPFVSVSENVFEEVKSIVAKIGDLSRSRKKYDVSILRTYLQLILALCSKEKQVGPEFIKRNRPSNDPILDFQDLLNEHFIESRSVSFYAAYYGLSVDTFSKKVMRYFGKRPSKLIQERLILEAKRLLHLSRKSIKEIATELHIDDEFYFSRYFKKEVGVSPKKFRETVGISIVAK